MSKVFAALAVSADGYITGRDPGAGRGLGDGTMLFDWYFDGDTASLAGRSTYDDSGWINGGTPHPTAPLIVLSHRPVPGMGERQTLITTAALAAGLVDEVILHQVPSCWAAAAASSRDSRPISGSACWQPSRPRA